MTDLSNFILGGGEKMKKLIQVFIVCLLVVVMGETASGKEVEIPNYYEFIKSIESDKYFVSGTLDTFVGDTFTDLNAEVSIETSASPGKSENYNLFRLECEGKICSVRGHIDYQINSFSPPDLVFNVESYETSQNKDAVNVKDIYKKLLNTRIYIEGPVSWGKTIDMSWVNKNISKTSPSLPINGENLDKEIKIQLIKECFKKCKDIRFEGKLIRVGGSFRLEADKFLKLDIDANKEKEKRVTKEQQTSDSFEEMTCSYGPKTTIKWRMTNNGTLYMNDKVAESASRDEENTRRFLLIERDPIRFISVDFGSKSSTLKNRDGNKMRSLPEIVGECS